jgi:hypothetical protein
MMNRAILSAVLAAIRSLFAASLIGVVLAGCGGAARSVLPSGGGSGGARNGGVVVPTSSNVDLFNGTLWYGAGASLYGVPLQPGGARAELDGTTDGIVDPVAVAMTIARDGTLYDLIADGETGWQLQAYAPGTFGSARPEEVIAGTGYPQQVVLVGDGIDVLSTVNFNTASAASTLWTYAYGAGNRPAPIRRLNLGANVNDVATDNDSHLYVARRGGGISVYAAAATCNCGPIRTIQTGSKTNDAIAISRDGVAYVLSKDPNAGTTTIDAYSPSNNGPSPSLSIGPIPASRGTPMGGITVDSDGKLYVNFKDARNLNSTDVYPPGSNGRVAPQSSIVTPVQGGYVTAIAIGPLVAATPPPAPAGTLYVVDGVEVNAFALTASGNAPHRTIAVLAPDFAGGPAYDSSQSIATASDGRLFAVRNSSPQANPRSCSIAEERPDAGGAGGLLSATPCDPSAMTLLARGPNGLVDEARLYFTSGAERTEIRRGVPANGTGVFTLPYAVNAFATDPRGEIYVAQYSTVTFATTVFEYAANAPNGAAPVRTIAVPAAFGLAISADGTLFAGDNQSGRGVDKTGMIYVVPPGATSPARTITLPSPGLLPVEALAVDAAGELFVGGSDANGNQTVQVFAPGASGAATPIRTISNPVSAGTVYGLAVAE